MAEKTVTRTVVVDLGLCLACRGCETACALAHAGCEDIVEALLQDARLIPRVRVIAGAEGAIPVQCQHCEDAPCVEVCPSGALYRVEAGGPVLTEPEECTGCRACVAVCPYGAVRLSDGKAVKCDLCDGLVDAGEELACVAACPTGARRAVSPEELARLRKEEEFVDVYQARMREAREASGEPGTYTIDSETCICCGRCARECPVDCISGKAGKVPAKATEQDREEGKVGEPFSIDQETCVHCGTCFEVCPVDAVQREQTPRDS